MESTTESLVAVIGYPIAGNPTQFALERAFESVSAECRVLSLELPDRRLAEALAGMVAMDFLGVWVDQSRRHLTETWLRSRTPEGVASWESDAIDLLARMETSAPEVTATETAPVHAETWVPHAIRGAVWPTLVQLRMQRLGLTLNKAVLVGFSENRWPQRLSEAFPTAQKRPIKRLDDYRYLEDVELIVLGPSAKVDLDKLGRSLKPSQRTGGGVIIDLSEDWTMSNGAEVRHLATLLGAELLSRIDVHAASLAAAVLQWTGRSVAEELLSDAIEEYLAV